MWKGSRPTRPNDSLFIKLWPLVRAYANIAGDMEAAGFDEKTAKALAEEVGLWVKVRDEVKIASGDAIDLKAYEPDMRHLIDQYVRAHDSEKLTSFDDLSLVQLLAKRGASAVEALPDEIKNSEGAVAEVIVNNVRRLIIDESPVNPKYYEKMSQLLDALIQRRHEEAISYRQYLEEVTQIARELMSGEPTKLTPLLWKRRGSARFTTTWATMKHSRSGWTAPCAARFKTAGAATPSKPAKSAPLSARRCLVTPSALL